MQPSQLGILATFRTAPDIFYACEQTRDAGYRKFDAFTPFPVHGLEKAMGLRRSRVPIFTFIGGATGFFSGIAMVWLLNLDYPLVVGGKPLFSPIFPFPVFYELTILLAAFGTLFGMFFTNFLPKHHHPLFEIPAFKRATDDTFFLMIETADPKFEETAVREFLTSVGGEDLTVVYDTEDQPQTSEASA